MRDRRTAAQEQVAAPQFGGGNRVGEGIKGEQHAFTGTPAVKRGKRGGTENTPAIAGMAAALREAVDHMAENTEKVTRLRETLIAGLSTIEHARLNGDRAQRVPGTVNFCFEGIEGESLLLLLDRKGIAASSGSAWLTASDTASSSASSSGISPPASSVSSSASSSSALAFSATALAVAAAEAAATVFAARPAAWLLTAAALFGAPGRLSYFSC